MCYIFTNLEQTHALHQNGVEFHQKFNGHDPSRVNVVETGPVLTGW